VADVAAGEERTTAGEAADTEETTTAGEAADTEEPTADEASSEGTITQEKAIELAKERFALGFNKILPNEYFGENSGLTYNPADALEEKDGSQYYVVYVKELLEDGNDKTIATYMVKNDGSEVLDKSAESYAGEYARTGEAGEVTFVVSADNTFKMITTGTVNQEISGMYTYGITKSNEKQLQNKMISVIKKKKVQCL
jgi:hypothetical protein